MSYRKKKPHPKPSKPAVEPAYEKEYRNPGVIRDIHSSRITSGLSYQRDLDNPSAKKLIREWDDRLFDPLIVSFRDGRYNLIDGQHRLTALRYMNGGDDVIVQCRVFTGMTYEEEAAMCVQLDKSRNPMRLSQSVNATLEAGNDPKLNEIWRLTDYEGFKWPVGHTHSKEYEIVANRALISAYDLLGASLFDRMLVLLRNTWKGEPVSLCGMMLSGLALFLKTYETELDDDTFVRRLSTCEPAVIIRQAKSDYSTNNSALRCARGLLDKYNKGSRGGKKLAYRLQA